MAQQYKPSSSRERWNQLLSQLLAATTKYRGEQQIGDSFPALNTCQRGDTPSPRNTSFESEQAACGFPLAAVDAEAEQAGKVQLTTGTPLAFVIGATLPFIGAPAQQSASSIDQGNCWLQGHQLAVSKECK